MTVQGAGTVAQAERPPARPRRLAPRQEPGGKRRGGASHVSVAWRRPQGGMMNVQTRIRPAAVAGSPAERVARIDWGRAAEELSSLGAAILQKLLTAEECRAVATLYPEDERFRKHIVMARHGFGKGEYKYFAYPLPEPIGSLRAALYPRLAPVANEWHERMGIATRYPPRHNEFLKLCHAAGQTRPTPLLLQYGPGDYNCLHQDLYGELAFPLQVAVLLSEPGEDFTGGEFVLTEQRPRMQSRAEVVPLRPRDAVAFAFRQRPVEWARGVYRVYLLSWVRCVRSVSIHTPKRSCYEVT